MVEDCVFGPTQVIYISPLHCIAWQLFTVVEERVRRAGYDVELTSAPII